LWIDHFGLQIFYFKTKSTSLCHLQQFFKPMGGITKNQHTCVVITLLNNNILHWPFRPWNFGCLVNNIYKLVPLPINFWRHGCWDQKLTTIWHTIDCWTLMLVWKPETRQQCRALTTKPKSKCIYSLHTSSSIF
jgi:hypothetical protein